ncbi:MAG: hypothetical protein KAI74_06165 [Kiritimatiellae bacterium]|nr:hypothetical protein [Kiritimatiellia bacterium]
MKNNRLTRRDALLSGGRIASAGLLAGLASFLLFKKKNPAKGNQVCISSGICRGCKVFDGCGLPQALSAKASGE